MLKKRHEYAKDWKKRTKGKVVASFSGYDPEEVIYAAGALPVHVMGGYEPDSIVAPHLYTWNCGPSRDVLSQALRGRYDYVDGLVMTHDCMHMKQTFDVWEKQVPIEFSYDIYLPRNVKSKFAVRTFTRELTEFKTAIQKWTNSLISTDKLVQAIDIYNENRSLMRQVYELRKENNSPITGTEALEMVLAGMVMDKREHNVLLKQFLIELSQRKGNAKGAVRVILIGSCVDNVEALRTLESFGALVITDELCTGTRYFLNDVEKRTDLLEAIAERYVNKIPHPEKDMVDRMRPRHVAQLAVDYRAQAAIILLHKYCDRLEWELPQLRSALKEKNVPSVVLEDDIIVPKGQWQIRTEALLEMVEHEGLLRA
jgi:benzoyl-CoA reductase subunit C